MFSAAECTFIWASAFAAVTIPFVDEIVRRSYAQIGVLKVADGGS